MISHSTVSAKMKGFLQFVIGLLFFVATAFLLTYPSWMWAAVKLLQGGVVFALFFIGLGFLLISISEIKG